MAQTEETFTYSFGAITRGNQNQKQIALVFTGHEYAEGGEYISKILKESTVKASFFFTGDFYRNSKFQTLIDKIKEEGHYLGAHSDRHLLYCAWGNRDSLLVDKEEFISDLAANYKEMRKRGIPKSNAQYYLPSYEWYNDSISQWTHDWGLQLINFTSGTRSNADYTDPTMPNYVPSQKIFESIVDYEQSNGLNGFILLLHIGVGSKREDKFYILLPRLITELENKGYRFVNIETLLNPKK
ncbi:polysaccharide deacetylase family protein [Echinicola sp. CAU 1574]|uniref:Polysaccharide deacetylase family protein n=1 Tax=Echinicola arenosa TaxID=2774144 RepID=A0ABR9AGM8_9BACT|nr:polysaccharide deacetylase family protein [Echinicola arenosa]MBD8487913.1 polysaccharide deacetylase family protein [Echinicola arenosa]